MSVLYDYQGPDWPLGFIELVTPGVPVSLMSLVDPTLANDPDTQNVTGAGKRERTFRGCQLRIQASKPGASHGTQDNAGNIYLVRRGGSRDDGGTIIATVLKGTTLEFPGHPAEVDCISPYRYYLDGDNAGDGAYVTLMISLAG